MMGIKVPVRASGTMVINSDLCWVEKKKQKECLAEFNRNISDISETFIDKLQSIRNILVHQFLYRTTTDFGK